MELQERFHQPWINVDLSIHVEKLYLAVKHNKQYKVMCVHVIVRGHALVHACVCTVHASLCMYLYDNLPACLTRSLCPVLPPCRTVTC